MSASEFPSPDAEGVRGIVASPVVMSQIEALRARVVVVHNSRILIAMIFLVSVSAAFIAICAVIYAISLFIPMSGFSVLHGVAAAQWLISGLLFAYMCPFLWKMASKMVYPRASFDGSGVQFNLGTKKAPLALHMPWDRVSSIQQQRVGNAQQFTVKAADGGYVQFNSYTFFRPKKVVRLIAERTGLTIQKI
jgi:hypothetical protein